MFLLFNYLENKEPNVVYLDNVKVFSTFNLAKDLNTLHQKKLNSQKKIVDSLVTILKSKPEESPSEEMQKRFVFENNKLKEMGDYFSNEVSQQVWNRLNSYIKEYGEQNKYSIILGTQGNGNIMYGNPTNEITEDFIEYANKKYEGEQ